MDGEVKISGRLGSASVEYLEVRLAVHYQIRGVRHLGVVMRVVVRIKQKGRLTSRAMSRFSERTQDF